MSATRRLVYMSAALGQQILMDRERWVYWLPVFLAAGIGLYFLLPFEPYLWLSCMLLAACTGMCVFLRGREPWNYLAILVTAISLGMTAASLRTHIVMHDMLGRDIRAVMLEGDVRERETRDNGYRLLLENIRHDRQAQVPELARVRLTLRAALAGEAPQPGMRIKVLASLLPISEPASPGGYDFRRQLYFEQIGATAIALRAPETIEDAGIGPSRAEEWRNRAAARIHAAIDGSEGAIAVALMTGERGAIDEKTNEDMRKAGTAHMLSISGMHIGMVGGFVFFAIRAFLALFSAIALRYPVKKAAAIIALLAVTVYTWLVGAPIPAQRALLMSALVFLAVLLDRQALSMRSVALAAGVILLLFPESLLNPGFQMSFAAIVMLVAAYEWWRSRQSPDYQPGWLARSRLYVLGIVVTSLIAGFATMPYSAWHFHRLQLLGVLGNLIATPLTAFIIMPMAVIAYVLLPLGLEGPVLFIMGWGLKGVTASAAWVGSLPGADINVAQFRLVPLLLMTLGGLWLAIWRRPVRWAGLGLILFGTVLVPFHAMPVALISAEGQVALRGPDGHLYYERPPRGLIAREWSRAYDDGREGQKWRTAGSGVRCDRLGCVGSGSIAIPRYMEALRDDCFKAAFVILPDHTLRAECRAQVIDRQSLRRFGSHAVDANGNIKTVREGSPRPWQPYYRTERSGEARAVSSAAAARPDDPAP